jgi:hypothetical protein
MTSIRAGGDAGEFLIGAPFVNRSVPALISTPISNGAPELFWQIVSPLGSDLIGTRRSPSGCRSSAS